MNLVSTNTKQLHSSQQNWKLKHTPFGTRNHSPTFQKLIKLPIFTKKTQIPQSLFPTITHWTNRIPHHNLNPIAPISIVIQEFELFSHKRPKLQPTSSKVQQTTQSEMNLVSTTTKQLHSSQQNWKLNPIPFGTSSHSPISQTPIKAPIYTKTPKSPQFLFPTINHPHPSLQYQPQPHYHTQNSNFCR
jgi:hypothetical protein